MYLGLKLILKVGGSSTTSTPEHNFETAISSNTLIETQEDNLSSLSPSVHHYDTFNKMHKKSKKKKEKKKKTMKSAIKRKNTVKYVS